MLISENMTVWAGKPVVDWTEESGVTDPAGSAYRLRVEYDADVSWADQFAAFLQDPRAGEVTALVIGTWDEDMSAADSTPVVEALVSASDRLLHLTALFLGDITYEENEISWIQQSDVSPLFNAFPALQHFGVRGGNGLSLGRAQLPQLKTLIVESGGLPRRVVEDVFASDLPALENLELWLGDVHYGAEATMDDLTPVLGETATGKWPNLRSLGLRDTALADEIAQALAQAPLLGQLEILDLSLGTLSDVGTEALIVCQDTAHLKRLDIHYHYVSPENIEKLKGLGIEVNAEEPQMAGTRHEASDRYVAVGE